MIQVPRADMQKKVPVIGKPPIKSYSINQKNKENVPYDINSLKQRVQYEIIHRKDKSFSSVKDLSPMSNKSNDSFSGKVIANQKIIGSRPRYINIHIFSFLLMCCFVGLLQTRDHYPSSLR